MSAAAQIQPYLFFGGNCEEALAFYKQALGAEVGMLMHADFRVGDALIMASDGCNPEDGKFGGFSLALSLPTVDQVNKAFDALSDGGRVTMPLGKTFWSERFGMLTDRFGIGWMVMVAEKH
jgi:PhnB protein